MTKNVARSMLILTALMPLVAGADREPAGQRGGWPQNLGRGGDHGEDRLRG